MIPTFNLTTLTGNRLRENEHAWLKFEGGPSTFGGISEPHVPLLLPESHFEEPARTQFVNKLRVLSTLTAYPVLRSIQFLPTHPEISQTWYVENHTGSAYPSYSPFFKPYADFFCGGIPQNRPPLPAPTYFDLETTQMEEIDQSLEDVQDPQAKEGLKQALLHLREDSETETLAVSYRDGDALQTKVWSWIRG